MQKMGDFQPRLTFIHGVVAVLETQYWGGNSDYENLTGEAYGVGVGWTKKNGNVLSLDLLAVNVDVPQGTIEQGGSVKISIGYTINY